MRRLLLTAATFALAGFQPSLSMAAGAAGGGPARSEMQRPDQGFPATVPARPLLGALRQRQPRPAPAGLRLPT